MANRPTETAGKRVSFLIGSTLRGNGCNFQAKPDLHARARHGTVVAFTGLPIPPQTDVPVAEPGPALKGHKGHRAKWKVEKKV
jgi:hypothetical protein